MPQGMLSFLLPNSFAYSNKTYTADINFLPDRNYLENILRDIENAKHRIYIAIYFFKATGDKKNPASKIERALMRAAKKGIDVYVIMEVSKYKNDLSTKVNKNTAKYLKRAGVKVIFDNPKIKLHSKSVVIDDIVYIGSHNFTKSAMNYNHETSLRVVSKKLADDVAKYIKSLK
jgi:phosphatidylserine/phosphatidylglycerophosphate/cardiolipin synthase-like enzyme